MADILVFHHGDDRAAAEMLADALGKLGFEPPAGYDDADFIAAPQAVSAAIDLSVAGIVLWSATSVASHAFYSLAELVSAKGRLLSVCGPATRPPLDFDDPPAHELIEWDGADLKHPGVVALSHTLTSRYGVRRHWAAAAMQAKAQQAQEPAKMPWLKTVAKAVEAAAPAAVAKPPAPVPAPAPAAAAAKPPAHKFSPAEADPREEPVFRSWKKPVAPAPGPVEIPAEILEAVAAQQARAALPEPEPIAEPADPLEQPVFKFMKSARRNANAKAKPALAAAKVETPKLEAPKAEAHKAEAAKAEAPKREVGKGFRQAKAEELEAFAASRRSAPAPALESELPAGFKSHQPIVFPPSAEPAAKPEPSAPVMAPQIDWAVAARAFAAPPAPLFVAEPNAPAAPRIAEQRLAEQRAAEPRAAEPIIAASAPPADAPAEPAPFDPLRRSGAAAIAAMTGGGAFAGALAGVASAFLANQGFMQTAATETPHEAKVDETSPTVGSLLGLDAQARDARDASGFTTLPARAAPARATPAVQRVSHTLETDAASPSTQLPPALDDEALTRALNIHMLAPAALQAFPADEAGAKADKLIIDFSALPGPAAPEAEMGAPAGEPASAGAVLSAAPQAETLDEEAL
jgi:hypothetical protein